MYDENDFLNKSLQIINNNRIKSNSLKNHFLKNIMNNEYVSQFLGYLSELEYDLESLNNYISDFQLLYDNMMQNLEESNIKNDNYINEVNRLKKALNRANEEIHFLRNQSEYNREIYNRKKFIINEEVKNIDNSENNFNYFRNYLNSTPFNTFRRKSKNNRQGNNNINNDIYGRFTYYIKDHDNNKLSDNNNLNQKNTNIKTFNKSINKIDDNDNNKNNNRKSQSSNKIKKLIKNNINNKGSLKKANIKNKIINNNLSNTFDNYKSANNSNHININLDNNTIKSLNNGDIKEFLKENPLNNSNINKNYYSQFNLNNTIDNNNIENNCFGKIITHNNTISSPINQINYNRFNNPLLGTNNSFNNFPRKESAIILSKRMQNYIHNQNLKKRFEEISKDNTDIRQNRINNIIEIITDNRDKLKELKLIFGNNIEAQILNGDLNDTYLNKIENVLYYLEKSKSIIPLSKRFQIQNHSSKKKNKIANGEEYNIKSERLTRKKINDKNYNKNNIKKWNTTKNFFDNKNKNKF